MKIDGYVRLDGAPVSRTVRIYKKSTRELVAETSSNPTTGYFSVIGLENTMFLVIAFSENLQPIAYDRIYPEEE